MSHSISITSGIGKSACIPKDIVNHFIHVCSDHTVTSSNRHIQQGLKLKHRHAISSRLLDILQHAIENPETLASNKQAFYAMLWLAQLKEKKAFYLMLEFLSLPGPLIEAWIIDPVRDHLHNVIASLYVHDSNHLSLMESMIEDPTIYSFSRLSVMRSLLTLVKEEVIDKHPLMHYFQRLFQHPSIKSVQLMMTYLIQNCVDLYAVKLYPLIKKVMKNKDVNTELINAKRLHEIFIQADVSIEKGLLTEVSHQYGFINDVTTLIGKYPLKQCP